MPLIYIIFSICKRKLTHSFIFQLDISKLSPNALTFFALRSIISGRKFRKGCGRMKKLSMLFTVLAVLLALSLIFSCALISAFHFHGCVCEECSICRIIRYLKSICALLCFGAISAFTPLCINRSKIIPNILFVYSLISMKVELLN